MSKVIKLGRDGVGLSSPRSTAHRTSWPADFQHLIFGVFVDSTTQRWQRAPKNPGAPIIPHGEWDFPPYHRWTFQHGREMVPTAQIWRGPGPVLPLPERKRDIDGVSFESRAGRRTIPQWLDECATDGFLVLSHGTIIDERYMNGLKPYRQHLAMSVSKSVTSAVFGILAERGLIDPEALVTQYLQSSRLRATTSSCSA